MGDVRTAEGITPSAAEQVRRGLSRLVKAAVVVTAWHQGQRWATTATAVSELGMAPPSLLVCLDNTIDPHPPLTTGAYFCINILHAGQLAVSRSCSGDETGEARFAEGRWGSGACGTPYLCDAQANFICEVEDYIDRGAHAILIGTVMEMHLWGEVDPLIYVGDSHARVAGLA